MISKTDNKNFAYLEQLSSRKHVSNPTTWGFTFARHFSGILFHYIFSQRMPKFAQVTPGHISTATDILWHLSLDVYTPLKSVVLCPLCSGLQAVLKTWAQSLELCFYSLQGQIYWGLGGLNPQTSAPTSRETFNPPEKIQPPRKYVPFCQQKVLFSFNF